MTLARRQVLKVLAAVPLLLPLGLAISPVMRYLKPTMGPMAFFDPADQPCGNEVISFCKSDFPEIYTTLPFKFPIRIPTFSPEGKEVRDIPGFITRLPHNRYVAYSRNCPAGRGILNYMPADEYNRWLRKYVHYPTAELKNPVLYCCCDVCTFDLGNDGRVLGGRAPRAPYKFDLDIRGDKIIVIRQELGRIN